MFLHTFLNNLLLLTIENASTILQQDKCINRSFVAWCWSDAQSLTPICICIGTFVGITVSLHV